MDNGTYRWVRDPDPDDSRSRRGGSPLKRQLRSSCC